MILKMFCVKDSVTGVFGTPMFLVTPGQATREFTDVVNRADKENPIYLHPNDYDLYYVGDFDNESGTFATVSPDMIARGANVTNQEVN